MKWQLFVALVALIATVQCRPGDRRGPPPGPRREVTEEPNSSDKDHTGVPPHNPKNCTDHPHDETTDRPRPGPPGRGGHGGRHRRDFPVKGRGPPAGLPPRREVTEEPNSAEHDHTGVPPHDPKNCTIHPHDETTDRPRPGPPGRGGPGMPGMPGIGGRRGGFRGRDRRAAGKPGQDRRPSPPTGSPPTGNPPTGNPPPHGGSGSGAPPPPPPQGGSGSGAPPPPPRPRG